MMSAGTITDAPLQAVRKRKASEEPDSKSYTDAEKSRKIPPIQAGETMTSVLAFMEGHAPDKNGNRVFICRLCNGGRTHEKRALREHLQRCIPRVLKPGHAHAADVERFKNLVEASGAKDVRVTKKSRELALEALRSTLDTIDRKVVDDLLAKFLIDAKLPFATVEREFFCSFVNAVSKLSRQFGGTLYTLPSRHTISKIIMATCDSTSRAYILKSGMSKDIVRLGCGLSVDGRTNVFNTPNEVAFLLTSSCTLLIKTFDSSNGKDQKTLKGIWSQAIEMASSDGVFPKVDVRNGYIVDSSKVNEGNAGGVNGVDINGAEINLSYNLGQFVFYCVSDNAAAPAAARRTLERERGIISVGCLAHIMSLLPKHLVSKASGVPFVADAITSFETITDVFRDDLPRRLLMEKRKVQLRRLIATRFMDVFYGIQHFIAHSCGEKICDVLESTEFVAYETSCNAATKSKIAAVKVALYNPLYSLTLQFLIRLMAPWVQAMREFDRSRNNVYIFYPLMKKLGSLATDVMLKDRYQAVVTDHVRRNVSLVFHNFVRKFDLPIYTAAYALCPAFRAEVAELAGRRDVEFYNISRQLKLVFTVMAMRAPVENGCTLGGMVAFRTPRDIFAARAVASTVFKEWRDYLARDGFWNPSNPLWTEVDLQRCDPIKFFEQHAPGGALRYFATAVLSIVAATSATVRGQKVNHDTLTASRSHLCEDSTDSLIRTGVILAAREQEQRAMARSSGPSSVLEFFARLQEPVGEEPVTAADDMETTADTTAATTMETKGGGEAPDCHTCDDEPAPLADTLVAAEEDAACQHEAAILAEEPSHTISRRQCAWTQRLTPKMREWLALAL
eukprot:m.211871 g.211871  ORF g.211871 m.211871 type:complete len:847 (-) comp10140_c0_seq9:97-2637(-)